MLKYEVMNCSNLEFSDKGNVVIWIYGFNVRSSQDFRLVTPL